MGIEQKPIIAISLLSEIAQAISHLNADRALLFLTESAVSVTESAGALLLTPHEKSNTMIPFVKSFQESTPEIDISESFLRECFVAFLQVRDSVVHQGASEVEISEKYPLHFLSAWPVMLSGKPVALLIVFKPENRDRFTTEQTSFLEIVTPFMGSLLENFRLNNEMIHKNSRLSALYEISQQAESLIDFRDIYDALGKVARSFINFDAYLLYFVSADGTSLEARVEATDSESFPKTIKIGEGPVGLAAKELKPYLTYTKDYNSVLILPIEVSGRLIGVLAIGSCKPYAYRDEDIIGLRIIATQIASIDHMFKDLISLKGFTERILESMTSGVLIFDPAGKVTYANPEIRLIMERQFPEGWNPFETDDKLPSRLHELMIEVLTTNVTLENEKVKIKHSNPARIVEVNAFPFRNEAGGMLGTACFIKDVTQISALEEQLRRADKLSALGVLAAGISHEIRNPLTGMKMIVQLLESEFSVEDSRREPLRIIQGEIDRLEGIVGNLLDFAKPSKPKAIDVDVGEVIDDCCKLARNQINKQRIRFARNICENCPQIVGDPDQLKQVFLNILTNAIQALKPDGLLAINIDQRDESVVVAFEDSGSGIPPERLPDIFNPFMTTKEDGTGLGLSMAQRIVEEHGGRIEVQSVLGEGSTFSVVLPRKLDEKC